MGTKMGSREEERMSLEQLDGAVLKYEKADGETVTVEFDQE
ncbi:hypothetical protein [Halobellus inordinatus]|nr:hypothetical protein [Halobellus ramosii]